eukprot:14794558-Ditylum_brightwellii.AAC.1
MAIEHFILHIACLTWMKNLLAGSTLSPQRMSINANANECQLFCLPDYLPLHYPNFEMVINEVEKYAPEEHRFRNSNQTRIF